jgi:hypothetical protein
MFTTDEGSNTNWAILFSERDLKEIAFCKLYADQFAHGTDGHLIRLIVARLAAQLDVQEQMLKELRAKSQKPTD